MTLFERILEARGFDEQTRDIFLHPRYEDGHDPFLLPDMTKAVERLVRAREAQEHITIYGDYDIDGLTATTVLVDALAAFGFRHVTTFIPNRFVEGYGMTVAAVERIAQEGTQLIITVDCGSISEREIVRAKELGVDVIVTDHHNVVPTQPPAVAVINPKRLLQDYPKRYQNLRLMKQTPKKPLYPFLDLPGVGVAFKLVQALQTRLDGLAYGQEKWLLDLVALGTVCDVVTLVDENRTHVYWGLKVLAKTRRPGLKALMTVAGVEPHTVNARALGFGLGPRMNAAGRLETARIAQDMLLASDGMKALELAQELDRLNAKRRADQDVIVAGAVKQAEMYEDQSVLVVSHADWNHGIVGIVAAKLLEKYKKPTYVLQEMGDESKGSARSYGDFSAADAIRANQHLVTKGGGHKLAAGVTLPTANIEAFRKGVNDYFASLKLPTQPPLLLARADVTVADFTEINEALVEQLSSMEPFGNGNPEPILRADAVTVTACRSMGSDGQHCKLEVEDKNGRRLQLIAFHAEKDWYAELGKRVDVWFTPLINEWRGVRSVEGRLVRLEHG
ncbi:DHH family phosphoesterase [Candidatus Saccharibacteria bacterium]|nr:MAG: DHH family phosphoesterase [Candidatus Saccharibacteria bacterium]